jgi:PKHD-type hydroxylase
VEVAAQPATDVWRPDYAPGTLVGVFTPAMCERVIAIAEGVGFGRSLVYGEKGAPADDPNVRSSDSARISAERHREYYAVIADVVRKYNTDHCRFSVTGLDALQVIRYRPGARFKMHSDVVGEVAGANRKISLILQLSDENDYTGGELVFADDSVVPRTRGGGCIFPAWIPHEVLPVTSGLRYSLVTWAVGDCFR